MLAPPIVRALVIVAAFSAARPAPGQDRLEPEAAAFARVDEPKSKMRDVFRLAFEKDVVLRVLRISDISSERVVGLRKSMDGEFEVFRLDPGTRVYWTYFLRELESREGQLKPHELESLAFFKEMKTPSEYDQIAVKREARPIPADLAEDIRAIWERMLLRVGYLKSPHNVIHGEYHQFSAWIFGRGEVSSAIQSPWPRSKAGRLVALSEAMASYARDEIGLDVLKGKVEGAREAIVSGP